MKQQSHRVDVSLRYGMFNDFKWFHISSASSTVRFCEVFRPRADLTIQYSPTWGNYLVTCIDGELSKDYLVKDRPVIDTELQTRCMLMRHCMLLKFVTSAG